MTSIGLQNPINGSYGSFAKFVASPGSSGGAIKGYMPNATVDTDKTYIDYEQIRFALNQAWNTTYPSQLKITNKITSRESRITWLCKLGRGEPCNQNGSICCGSRRAIGGFKESKH